jgi:DNA-binding response OmpR family regulator
MAQARLLVVEDEDLVREWLVEALVEAGFAVDEAATGDEAAKLVDGGGYVLLVTDITMPGRLDGVDLAARARGKHPGMPIVFVTGGPDATRKGRVSGARTSVISKPCTMDSVVRTVRQLLDG